MSVENLVDLDLPRGMSVSVIEGGLAGGAREAIAALTLRVASDPLVAWESNALELAAGLRGVDDLALQRMRIALKNARADVVGWERAVNEARKRTQSGTRGAGAPPPSFDVRERYTDAWNASEFAREYRCKLRFVPERGWHRWTGAHWEFDDQAGLRFATDFAIELAASADQDADIEPSKRAKLAEALQSRAKIVAIESLAKARPQLCVRAADFDQDPWLLNCANGTVDLRTGTLRPHDPDDLCSREVAADFDAEASAATFESFLARVQPDPEVRAFLQRWAGYCATGSTSEQCLVLHCGTGANGKSTFVEAINHVMARYAQLVPSDVLLARSGNDAHPTERATLCGLRHALVSETAGGKGWNENAVKQLTGDSKMSARYMRQDFFEFTLTHKLSVCTNNRPEVREHSHAFWRRVHLIPWAVQIPDEEKDPQLLEKLRGEAIGILSWIVRGAVAWAREGLAPPEKVRAATAAYRNESDRLGLFLEERTRPLDGARVPAGALYKAWSEWCEDRGESPGSQTAFGERMGSRDGVTRVKSRGAMVYRGIALATISDAGGDEGQLGDSWGDGWGTVATSQFPGNFLENSAKGIVGDSCPEVSTPVHRPAPETPTEDVRAPSRAPQNKNNFSYADNRNNYPPLSPSLISTAKTQIEPGGIVGAQPSLQPSPDGSDGWEDP